jgi:hypothetical protein
MGYEISWLVERRIMAVRFFGNLTLAEIRDCTATGQHLLEEGIAPVHCLIDATDLERYPLRISDIYAVAPQDPHPKVGWTVFYGLKMHILTIIIRVLSELGRFPYRVATTRAEALALLAKEDPTLAGALAPYLSEGKS